MNFDRNTVSGFAILAVLFFGYFYFNYKEQAAYKKAQAREQFVKDSIAAVNAPKVDSVALQQNAKKFDSMQKQASAGTFATAAFGNEKIVTVENNQVRVQFSSKGGQIKKVALKSFAGKKQGGDNWVELSATPFDRFSYLINTSRTQTDATADLNFDKIDSVTNADGSKSISFTLSSTDSVAPASVTHTYTIRPNDYLIDFKISFIGADQLLTQGNLVFNWSNEVVSQESDVNYERQNTQVGFIEDGEFDYHTIGRKSEKEFSKSVSWLGIRQRFFFTAIAAKNGFQSGKIEWAVPSDKSQTVVKSVANLKMQLPVARTASADLSFYFGPSDYHLLKKYDQHFDKVVNLGQGVYTFVRPLNKYVIVPIFDFMKGISAGNLGLAILLLTIVIRLIISPLTYSSYLSGAKMKALRPEIAQLKTKFGDDQQAMSMEQMKLFREAGVNPLGGCIPALLQIPIFFALFSFFNSEVALRGAHFLWSHDLSAYDAPIQFGFSIPLLGSHISLFNLMATATSFAISIYSMSMTPDQSNPMMKYMPYIFPIFLLFFFNSLPSALTWYYTVSNLVTLILQMIIQNYIIDHDKVLAKIQENRKKPKTKSSWQEKMEQMQQQQQKLKEMQQKGKK
jgi:YidC/Oxa1 family membrane protein insertase